MHKNACEAILADRPDRGDHVDPRAAAEIEALRADNVRKDAEIEALRADNVRKDAEIEALRADNVRKDAEIEALERERARRRPACAPPPSHNTLSGKAEKSR